MSRSCHSAWSSRPATAYPRSRRARPGEPLGQDRVALVGHRAGALLARSERLLELADLGVLEVAHLGREALDGAAGDGDRGQERGVPVALHDLGADRVDVQAELGQDLRLDVRAEVAVGADRARRSCPWPGRRWPGGGASGRGRARRPTTASFRPKVMGSAWTEWVRPIMIVRACSRARRTTVTMACPRSARAVRRRPDTGARGPCRRRRCWSARGGGSALPGRPSRRPG